MTEDLNTVLSHLNATSGSSAKSKAQLLQMLGVPCPNLDSVIKKLNREGYVHVFMRSCVNHKELSPAGSDNLILLRLSRRGKAFIKNGGHEKTVHHIESMKSAVGF